MFSGLQNKEPLVTQQVTLKESTEQLKEISQVNATEAYHAHGTERGVCGGEGLC